MEGLCMASKLLPHKNSKHIISKLSDYKGYIIRRKNWINASAEKDNNCRKKKKRNVVHRFNKK